MKFQHLTVVMAAKPPEDLIEFHTAGDHIIKGVESFKQCSIQGDGLIECRLFDSPHKIFIDVAMIDCVTFKPRPVDESKTRGHSSRGV